LRGDRKSLEGKKWREKLRNIKKGGDTGKGLRKARTNKNNLIKRGGGAVTKESAGKGGKKGHEGGTGEEGRERTQARGE